MSGWLPFMKISISGIRGIYGVDLSLHEIIRFTRLFASTIKLEGRRCVLAQDTRPSSRIISQTVSASLMTYITSTLPDRQDLRTTNPDLLTTKAIADVPITAASDVFITFVSQGGGFTNTFGFYTYPTGKSPLSTKDIPEITYVFPNSGNGTKLTRGDKVKIGRFDAGTSIGFVLLQKGWDPLTKALDNKVVHFCSNDALNPEVDPALKKHAVLINYPAENKTLIGFEDVDRTLATCDHDFNDVVFYCTVKP